jgi:hypothetical protein
MLGARRTNWKRRAICLLEEEVGGRLCISLRVLFLPNGFEGESEGRRGMAAAYMAFAVSQMYLYRTLDYLKKTLVFLEDKRVLEGDWGSCSALRFLFIFRKS